MQAQNIAVMFIQESFTATSMDSSLSTPNYIYTTLSDGDQRKGKPTLCRGLGVIVNTQHSSQPQIICRKSESTHCVTTLVSKHARPLNIISVYMPQASHKQQYLAALSSLLDSCNFWAKSGPLLVGGDFNMHTADISEYASRTLIL
jgi:exonuclease III